MPTPPAQRYSLGETLALAAVFLLAAAAGFAGLGARSLWFEGDEALYSLAAMEMWSSQRTPWAGEPQPSHPLVPAVAAAFFQLAGGPDIILARIPSVLFSLATLALVTMTAWVFSGPVAGIFAAGVLASSFYFSFMARSAAPDMAIVFFQTAAMAALLAGYGKDSSRAAVRLFWAALAGGYYAGGIAALAPPLAGAWLMTRGSATSKDSPGRPDAIGALFDPAGLAVFLAATAPWFIFHSGGRAEPEDFFSITAAWEGIIALAFKTALFFPWIFAVPYSIQRLTAGGEERELALIRYLTGVVLGATVGSFFTGSGQALHIHAVLAVVIGGYIQTCHLDQTTSWKAPFISNLVAVLPLIGGTAAVLAPFWAPVVPFTSVDFLLLFLALYYIFYKLGEIYVKSGNTLGMWAGAVATSFLFLALTHLTLSPAMNRSFSHKVFFEQIEGLLGSGLDLRQYRMNSYQAGFYLGLGQVPRLADEGELAAFLENSKNAGHTVYILARARDREVLAKLTTAGYGHTPTVYTDSYFVPPVKRMEKDRYLIFKYPPEPAPMRSDILIGPPHRR